MDRKNSNTRNLHKAEDRKRNNLLMLKEPDKGLWGPLKEIFTHRLHGTERLLLWVVLPGILVLTMSAIVFMFLPRAEEDSDDGLIDPEVLAATARAVEQRTLKEQAERKEAARLRGIFEEGNEALRAGDYLKARETLSAYLAEAPEDWNAAQNLAVAYQLEGRTEEALGVLDAALQSHPGVASLHANRAQMLREAGRMAGALEAIKRASEIEPGNVFYSNKFLIMRIENGEIDGVRKAIETSEALRISTAAPSYIIAAAAVAAQSGDIPGAVLNLSRARTLLAEPELIKLIDDPFFTPYLGALNAAGAFGGGTLGKGRQQQPKRAAP